MKTKLIIIILSSSMFITMVVLMPSLTFAQNADDRVRAVAQEDCKKIAKRLGESVPAISITSNNSIIYSTCNFQALIGDTSKFIEDVKIIVDSITLNRYSTAESAKDDLLYEKKAASDSLARTSKSEMKSESITETSDGYFHILKFQNDLAGDVVAGNNIVLNDFIVNTLRGSCRIIVRGSSYLENDKKATYHFYGPGNEAIDTHPNFNHNREAEILTLTREKAEELLNLLGCDSGVSSSKSKSLNKSNYTQALIIDSPKESDFKKVKLSDFKKINPVSSASATKSANITDSVFLGKVDGEGEIIIDLPGGDKVTLTDDQTAFDGQISIWRFIRDFNQSPRTNSFHARVIMRDCHLDIRPANETRWASDWSVDKIISTGNCEYNIVGDPTRILVDTGNANFKTSSGVDIAVGKADFGISDDVLLGQSAVEIYNGSVTVKNKSGQAKTISSVYGSEIKQIEINKDGKMTEKIAIPLSEWEAFSTSQQEQEKKANAGSNLVAIVSAVGLVLAAATAGVIFFLKRRKKAFHTKKIR